jgi:hypothetical protein
VLAMRKIRTFLEWLQAETARRDGPKLENEEGVSERVLEPVSCVLGSEEKGRSGVIAVIELC